MLTEFFTPHRAASILKEKDKTLTSPEKFTEKIMEALKQMLPDHKLSVLPITQYYRQPTTGIGIQSDKNKILHVLYLDMPLRTLATGALMITEYEK